MKIESAVMISSLIMNVLLWIGGLVLIILPFKIFGAMSLIITLPLAVPYWWIIQGALSIDLNELANDIKRERNDG